MYNFQDFANDLENVIDHSRSYEEITKKGSSLMKKLVSNNELVSQSWAEDVLYGRVDNTIYNSNKNGFTIQLFAWEGHSSTPIHDHDTWGIMGIYHNKLFVTEYVLNNIDHMQYDLQVNQEYLAKNGDVCYLLPPDEEIHKIENPTNNLSVSIHVYGKIIKEYNIYDLENGEIVHQVV